jgi:hypothetical protein
VKREKNGEFPRLVQERIPLPRPAADPGPVTIASGIDSRLTGVQVAHGRSTVISRNLLFRGRKATETLARQIRSATWQVTCRR